MEWQQLEYFQTVANLQHMTLAAEKLRVSQPALSRSIARLEKELGVPLFERQGRSIIRNQYGNRFLEHVNNILGEYEAAKVEIQSLIDPESGEISLGFLHTLGTSYVPELIRSFGKKYPGIRFQLHQNSSQVLLNQLISGEMDLCLSYPAENVPQAEWNYLWSEELMLIVPAEHPFSKRKEISLEQIGKEPLISCRSGFGIRKITDELFEKADITPKIAFEVEEVNTINGLVAAGLGVAIVPEIKGINQEEINTLRVKAPGCNREIGIMMIRDRYLSPSAICFRQFVIDYFSNKNGEGNSKV